MTTKPKKPRFAFVVEALPSNVPAVIRLRGALKTLLRAFGLRCISIEEMTVPAQAGKAK